MKSAGRKLRRQVFDSRHVLGKVKQGDRAIRPHQGESARLKEDVSRINLEQMGGDEAATSDRFIAGQGRSASSHHGRPGCHCCDQSWSRVTVAGNQTNPSQVDSEASSNQCRIGGQMSLAHRLGTQMQVDFAIAGETQIGRLFEDPAGDLQKTAQTDTTQVTLPCRSLAPLFELIPLCEV